MHNLVIVVEAQVPKALGIFIEAPVAEPATAIKKIDWKNITAP